MISVENPPRGWCLAATVHWLFPSSEFPLMVVPAKWSHEEESKREWRDCEEKRVGVKVPLRVKMGSHTSKERKNNWMKEWRGGWKLWKRGAVVGVGTSEFLLLLLIRLGILLSVVKLELNVISLHKEKNPWRFHTWLELQWMAKSQICVCSLSIFF